MLKSFEELKQSGFNFQEFETKRQEMLAKRKKGLVTSGIVGGGISVVGLIMMAAGSAGLGIGVIVVGLIVFGIWYGIVSSNAKKELKHKLLNDILKKIDNSFSYQKTSKNFQQNFRKSGFVKSFTGVTVDDVFNGQITGMNFTLGEITVSRKQGEKSTVTVFKGPFAFIETTNTYEFTSIIPDRLEKSLGGLGRMLQKANISRLNQKLIKLNEDVDFEKKYAVWTKDEQTCRQILSPQFRDYLKNVALMTPVYVGFRENLIFFGMDNRKDLFGLKLKEQITESTIKRFYDEFADYYKIMSNIVSFSTTGSGENNEKGDVVPAPQVEDTVPPPPPQSDGSSAPPPPQF